MSNKIDKEEKNQEREIEIQNILEPYFVVLDGRCNDDANETMIELSEKIRKSEDQKIKALITEIKQTIKDNKNLEVITGLSVALGIIEKHNKEN